MFGEGRGSPAIFSGHFFAESSVCWVCLVLVFCVFLFDFILIFGVGSVTKGYCKKTGSRSLTPSPLFSWSHRSVTPWAFWQPAALKPSPNDSGISALSPKPGSAAAEDVRARFATRPPVKVACGV